MNKRMIISILIMLMFIGTNFVIATPPEGKPNSDKPCENFQKNKDKWEDREGDKWEEKKEKMVDHWDEKLEDFGCDDCDDGDGDNGDDGDGDGDDGDGDGDDGDGDGDGDDGDGDGDGDDGDGGSKGSSGKSIVVEYLVNIPPVADASAGEPYIGFNDEDIKFDGSLSYDLDGYIVDWMWRFSDTTFRKGEIVYNSFPTEGDYEVELIVIDNVGATNSTIVPIAIVRPNIPPTAPVVEGPDFGVINDLITFSAVSFDMDNDNLMYYFNWGNGLTSESLFVENGTEVYFKYSWDSAGEYTITVKSFDGYAFSEETVFKINIGLLSAATVIGIILLIIFILILIALYLIYRNRHKEKSKKIGH